MSKGHNFLSLVNVQSLGPTSIYPLLLLRAKLYFLLPQAWIKTNVLGHILYMFRDVCFLSLLLMIFRIKTILLDIQDIDIPLLKGEMITTL